LHLTQLSLTKYVMLLVQTLPGNSLLFLATLAVATSTGLFVSSHNNIVLQQYKMSTNDRALAMRFSGKIEASSGQEGAPGKRSKASNSSRKGL
jgi:hypothetical protein